MDQTLISHPILCEYVKVTIELLTPCTPCISYSTPGGHSSMHEVSVTQARNKASVQTDQEK
jgi:hypothetical protein